MTHGLGYRPDPVKLPHERGDFSAALKLRAVPLPILASNRRLIVSILDQGQRGSCVDNSVSQAARMSHVLQGAVNPPLSSRLFGYYLNRASMNEIHQDNGTYIRIAFQNRNKFGFCPESLWPYSDDAQTYQKMPHPDCFRAAYDQRDPTAYFRIFEEGPARILAVQRALAAGFGVVFGTSVSNAFCNNDLGKAPLLPPDPGDVAGSHAQVIAGYDMFTGTGRLYLDVCNSWGTGWGAGGYWKMSPEYLMSPDTQDLWICQAAPLYSDSGTAPGSLR